MKTKNNPVSGPTSAAGLVRYFDISGGGVEITPKMVMLFTIAFIVFEALLKIAENM